MSHALSYRPVEPDVRRFLLLAVLWNLALFALLRLQWVETHAIGALIELQKSVLFWYGVPDNPGILVDASCSGTDVMALCAGVTLAYPAAWQRRVAGAVLGLVVILVMNAVRIASLYAVASDASTLILLHSYVWPAVLVVTTSVYVFGWIRWSERQSPAISGRWLRFGLLAAALLIVYAAAVPWVFTSLFMAEAGVWTVSVGGALLTMMGAGVRTAGNVLMTDRGAFQVTQECLFTPVLPLYVAAVFSMPLSGRRRLASLMLGILLFFGLGVARLLLLALPPSISASPVVLAHGFYQIVAGAMAIVIAAHVTLRQGAGLQASRRTLAALGLTAAAAVVVGPSWTSGITSSAHVIQRLVPETITSLVAAGEQQGALGMMPAFQLGLMAGLWMAITGGGGLSRLVAGLAALAASQLAFLVVAGVAGRWLEAPPHAVIIRAWALVVPILIAASWNLTAGTTLGHLGYRRFWQEVGDTFPDLSGAASTRYYFENEKRLLRDALGPLQGQTLLKTDLWDEAKNTHILQWAASQGARVYGIDVSEPIVRQARAAFDETQRLRTAVSDVRRLPFGDASFDAIYSMGTVEHFVETEASIVELARVLKPGGRLILGVPNRHDPFLRPLLVALLDRVGLYAYGYEKSYSRRSLRRMIAAAGLDVRSETGILFMPGCLRMLDLWCHTRVPALARVTGALVQPFVWLDRRVPILRRHGYLLASVGEKAPASRASLADAGTVGPKDVPVGVQYVIDARGCDADALRSLPRLEALFSRVIGELALTPAAPPVWHVFPGHGGITGMVLLTESHLAIHTFPESGRAAIDLYCCRRSAEWPWPARLAEALGARDVAVRSISRG